MRDRQPEKYDEGRRALEDEARRCAAFDTDGAAYLMEVCRNMSPEPFDDAPAAALGGTLDTEDWMIHQPYHERPVMLTDPIPPPQPQPSPRVTPGTFQEMHNDEFMADLAGWWQ